MPGRLDALPVSKARKAFRAIDAILREDPTLSAADIRILSLQGDRADFATPATGNMPMIRILPVDRPDDTAFERMKVAVLGVKIESYVAGSNVDHLLDLWGAISDALVHDKPFRDTTVRCFLVSQGVDIHKSEKPGYFDEGTANPSFLGAEAVVLLKFLTPK